MIGAAEALALMLVAAIAGALFVVLPQWRRLMRSPSELPIHEYIAGRPSFEAEVRCAFCGGRQECRRRGKPLADCPNLELLQERKPL
jgi:hypothetical protein